MYGHPKHILDEGEARTAMLRFDRLALLVTHGVEGLRATHLPLAIEETRLIGHIARGTPQGRDAPCEALIVMPGAETYISPTWYET
ncbi:MAG: FMN-binding negative transcriptional regulator, partial [Hyphomonadaceae bacterium]